MVVNKIKTMKIKQTIKIFYLTIFTLLLNINFSFAQDATQNFKQTADNITNNVLASAGTLLMTAAFLFFFYGVVVFILGRVSGKGDLKELEKGKQFMLWGLIALFVMVSVWGIIRLAQDMLDVKGSDIQIKPVQFTPMAGGGNAGGNLANTNPVGGSTPAPAENNKFTKSEGASCVGLPGADSECATGMFCRKADGTPVKTGEVGVCKKSNEAYKPIIQPNHPMDNDLRSVLDTLSMKSCFNLNPNNFNSYSNNLVPYVKAFQKVNGLNATGIIAEDTWKMLGNKNAKSCTSCSNALGDCSAGFSCLMADSSGYGVCVPY